MYIFILLFSAHLVSSYTALPRWGQATALINDALFVHGGKTDQYNAYSYTAAPDNNDLLLLPLSSPFDPSSPPWQLVSSSTNLSTSQGPPVAWHSLSAFNTSAILLFGGEPDPNSLPVLPSGTDSAALLDLHNRLDPSWTIQPSSWAGQPTRRMHHSTSSTPDGLVYIIGGEKTDGSNIGLSDHYIFNHNTQSFSLLPTTNGPQDIFGHTSIILPTGQILVFGGYSQSQATLIPFSTIWAIDTKQSTLTWSTLSVSTTSLPSPRRAFASTLLDNHRILIHGGSDATLQSTYSDGWILDTSQNPLVWSQVAALTTIGARRDHFAVTLGSQVIFGFGYGTNAAAPAGLVIFDLSGSFPSSFSPPPVPSATTYTIPGASQTGNSLAYSGGSSGHGTGSGAGAHPTSSNHPGNDPNGGGTGGPVQQNAAASKTAAALGAAFGVLGLAAACVIIVYYVRRKRQRGARFTTLRDASNGDEGGSPLVDDAIPAAGPFGIGEKRLGGRNGGEGGWNLGILTSLDLPSIFGAGARRNARTMQARRDMLADEDTRDFGPWYDYEMRMRDGSGGSSWSLKTIFGARSLRSREPSASGSGRGRAHWREKTDPFSDAVALVPSGRREASYASYATTASQKSYVDPFADPVQEEPRDVDDIQDPSPSYPRPILPPLSLRTNPPISTGARALSPLAEQASRYTSPSDPSSPVSSHAFSQDHIFSPPDHSPLTSNTSFEPSGPRTTSFIDANVPPSQPMRRSDSWWARFSRTSFLDRRTSDPSRRSRPRGMFDIRDPNPPPRLLAIEESMHSLLPEPDQDSLESHRSSSSPGRKSSSVSRKDAEPYGGLHGKSATSLQTLRTTDSEVIERIAGKMDVVQSHRTRESTGSTLSAETHAAVDWGIERDEGDGDSALLASPVEITDAESVVREPPSPNSFMTVPSPAIAPSTTQPTSPSSSGTSMGSSGRKVPPPLSGGDVASRVLAYERRLSQDQELPSPTNTKKLEERTRKKSYGTTVNYGLVPKASLYVANPDHRAKLSGDS